MIVIHLSCNNQQVVPVIQFLVFRHHILVLLLDISLDIPQSLGMSKEMQTASQLTAHAAQVRNPFHKAMLKFRFRGYRHNDTPQRIDRHQEAGNHHLLISILSKSSVRLPKNESTILPLLR
jgi:hypothetical protein